jgi:hypothetical protein
MRRVALVVSVAAATSLLAAAPVSAANGHGGPKDPPPSIGVGVEGPGETGDGGGGEVVTEVEVVEEDPGCELLPVGSPCSGPEPAGPSGPAVDPVVLAQAALDSATIALPVPRTSPEGVPQITGMPTWFWLDPAAWVPVSARAEVPGLWAEVTATPVEATWTPGDGGAPVTCAGPGRPHPGEASATPDCGHTYVEVGAYTLAVAVTYDVAWTSSTGAGAALDPIVVTGALPVTVEQRQAVID